MSQQGLAHGQFHPIRAQQMTVDQSTLSSSEFEQGFFGMEKLRPNQTSLDPFLNW